MRDEKKRREETGMRDKKERREETGRRGGRRRSCANELASLRRFDCEVSGLNSFICTCAYVSSFKGVLLIVVRRFDCEV